MSTEATKTTLKGGCHCGRIKYECTVKPDSETGNLKVFRCNCTYCQKLSTTNLHLDGPEDFKLLSPASQEEVAKYPSKNNFRYYCAACGTHVWMEGSYKLPDESTHRFFVVNMCTIDQPQEGLELSKVKIKYWDGLNDNFQGGARDEPWPGGMV